MIFLINFDSFHHLHKISHIKIYIEIQNVCKTTSATIGRFRQLSFYLSQSRLPWWSLARACMYISSCILFGFRRIYGYVVTRIQDIREYAYCRLHLRVNESRTRCCKIALDESILDLWQSRFVEICTKLSRQMSFDSDAKPTAIMCFASTRVDSHWYYDNILRVIFHASFLPSLR